jgi:transposase InsO family protein
MPFRVEYMKGEIIPADCLSRPVESALRKAASEEAPDIQVKAVEAVKKYEKRAANEYRPFLLAERSNVAMTAARLYEAQQADMLIKSLAVLLKHNKVPSNPVLKSYVYANRKESRVNRFGLVTNKEGKVLVPTVLQEYLMIKAHDEIGHPGAERTLKLLANEYFWDNMKKDVENYAKSCEVCNQVKPPHHYQKTALGRYPTSTLFNERIHLDCITNLSKDLVTGNTAVLVITDAYSGFVLARGIKAVNAQEIIRVLIDDWISQHGHPRVCVSDQGSEFANAAFAAVCKFFQIEHWLTPAGVSKSNGLVERKNRLVVEFLRTYLDDLKFRHNDWSKLLPAFCLSYNVTIGERGFSPYFLVYSQMPNIPGLNYQAGGTRHTASPAAEKCRVHVEAAKKVVEYTKLRRRINEAQYKRLHGDMPEWSEGDIAYIRISGANTPKLQRLYTGPYIVLKVTNSQAYVRVTRGSARPFWVHLDRLKGSSLREPLTTPRIEDPERRTLRSKTRADLEAHESDYGLFDFPKINPQAELSEPESEPEDQDERRVPAEEEAEDQHDEDEIETVRLGPSSDESGPNNDDPLNHTYVAEGPPQPASSASRGGARPKGGKSATLPAVALTELGKRAKRGMQNVARIGRSTRSNTDVAELATLHDDPEKLLRPKDKRRRENRE